MRSLSARLSASLVLTLLSLTVLALVALNVSLRQLTETFLRERLEHDLDSILVGLSFDAERRLHLDSGRVNAIYRQPYSGHYFRVRAGEQMVRSRSLWDTDLPVPEDFGPADAPVYVPGPGDQELLVDAYRAIVQGQPLVVVLGEDFSPLNRGLERLMLQLMIGALVLVALLLAAQYLIVRTGLRPLRHVGKDLQRLARGEIRQLDRTVPVEVRPLTTEINNLLEVLTQRLQRSRNALGNLAHALKTPLAVLTQIADATPGENGRSLRHQTRSIRNLIERELKRARLAGPASPGQRLMTATEIEDLAATLRRIYRNKALVLEVRQASDTVLPGDRDDLLELLGNLLDNACQWAAGVVRLSLGAHDRVCVVTVEDDGPGGSAQQLQRLTRRGARLDEQLHGHGLGLAIVLDIVDQYGGTLAFDRSPALGGLRVTVELPRPAPAQHS